MSAAALPADGVRSRNAVLRAQWETSTKPGSSSSRPLDAILPAGDPGGAALCSLLG